MQERQQHKQINEDLMREINELKGSGNQGRGTALSRPGTASEELG